MNTEEEKILEVLRGVQLDQFYRQILDGLHVTRLNHFDHVTEEDLDGLGMSKPAQRRLFDALKKARKKTLFGSFRRKKSKTKICVDSVENQTPTSPLKSSLPAGSPLTCLISEKAIVLQEMIGNGAFGYVRQGEWTTDSKVKIDVAVKCLKVSRDAAFVQMETDFIKEANAMSLLDHPNIIKLYGIVLATPMMLVTELAPLGCLLTALRNNRQRFMISTLCEFAIQAASGMAYLESQRFIHRDLAARNLLLESYEKVKIGDFGLMRALSEEDLYYTMNPKGKVPFAWCPPEALKYRKFSHASDVWSFGICVIELFSYGEEPWPGLNGAQILAKVDMPRCERPLKPSHCPSQIYSLLVSRCWANDPANRSGFAVLKQALEKVRPQDVRSVHIYDSKSPQNLCFDEGDKITLIEASPDASWWRGQNKRTGRVGMFPSELVDGGPKPDSGSRNTSPTPVFKRVFQPPTSPQTKSPCSCPECGEKHVYEIPVLVSSIRTPASKPNGGPRSSSRSPDSEINFPGECDSGYSSSIDSRRRYHNDSELCSPDYRKDSTNSYENFSTGYETMEADVRLPSRPISIPDESVNHFSKESRSDPVSIPQRDFVSVRQRMSDPPNWGKIKGRLSDPLCGSPKLDRMKKQSDSGSSCISSSPKGEWHRVRCPLDFTNAPRGNSKPSLEPNGGSGSPPPLPPRTHPSSSSGMVVASGSAPMVARSPETKQRGSIGETFAKEMISYISNCSSENFNTGDSNAVIDKTGKPLVNQNGDIGMAGRSNSLPTRGRSRSLVYENHDILPRRRASLGSRGFDDKVRVKKENPALHQSSDNHKLKSEIAKAIEEFERHVYRKSSFDDRADLINPNNKVENPLERRARSNTSPSTSYENCDLLTIRQQTSLKCHPTSSQCRPMSKENRPMPRDDHPMSRDGRPISREDRSMSRADRPISPPSVYEDMSLEREHLIDEKDAVQNGDDQLNTGSPPTQEDAVEEIYCDMSLSALPQIQHPLSSEENNEANRFEQERPESSAPDSDPRTALLSKSFPSDFNFGLIERKIDLDGAESLVIDQRPMGLIRRPSSTGDIPEEVKWDLGLHCCDSDDETIHPVAPPRLKKLARQARVAAREKKLSVSVTGELASALKERKKNLQERRKERASFREGKLKARVVKGEILTSHSIKITVKKQNGEPSMSDSSNARSDKNMKPLVNENGIDITDKATPSQQRSADKNIKNEFPKPSKRSKCGREESIIPPLPERKSPTSPRNVNNQNELHGHRSSYENVTASKIPPLPRKGIYNGNKQGKGCVKNTDKDTGSSVLSFENKLIGFGLPGYVPKPSVAPLNITNPNKEPAPELPPKMKSPTSPLQRSSSWSPSRLSAALNKSSDGYIDMSLGPDRERYRPCPTTRDPNYEVPRRDVIGRALQDIDIPPPLPRKLSRQNTMPELPPRAVR